MYPELANQVCFFDDLGMAVCHTQEWFAASLFLAMFMVLFTALWGPNLLDRLLIGKESVLDANEV